MFIDNMGVLASLCKGSSVVADFGCVVHALLLADAKLNTRSWFEHVVSKANPADGGTRDSFESLVNWAFVFKKSKFLSGLPRLSTRRGGVVSLDKSVHRIEFFSVCIN